MERKKIAKYLIPAIILYIVIVVIFYNSYSNVVGIIESEYDATSELVEKSIYNETKYTEITNQVVDKDLSGRMKMYSHGLIKKYEEDKDVLNWDLKELKDRFNDVDIYIIDRNFEVINSTLDDEVGLTFEEYPDFLTALKKRINGDEFISDKINFSFSGKELRKYGYMPTPDNKYLLEFSVDVKEIFPEIEELNIFNLARSLREKYPFIHDIKVYEHHLDKKSSTKLLTSKNKEVSLSKREEIYIREAIKTGEIQSRTDEDDESNLWTYRYIPYNDGHINKGSRLWGGSYVIEVVYIDKIKMDSIHEQDKVFIRNIILVSALYFTSLFLILYIMKKNKEMADKDDLTKLINRKRFEEILESKKKTAKKRNEKIAILFFDLDKFKEINDTLGHNMGDEVLKEVANRIKTQLRKRDAASRIGGDELIALVEGVESEKDIEEVANRMSNIFKESLDVLDEKLSVKASIGLSVYPDDATTVEGLIEKADQAMYESKKNQTPYTIYSENNI